MTMNIVERVLKDPKEVEKLSKKQLIEASFELYKRSREEDRPTQAKELREAYTVISTRLTGEPQTDRAHDEAFVSDRIDQHYKRDSDSLTQEISVSDILNSRPGHQFSGRLSDKLPLLIKKVKNDPSLSRRDLLELLNSVRYNETQPDFQEELDYTTPRLIEKYGRTTRQRVNYLKNVLKKNILEEQKPEGKIKVLRVSHDYNRNTGGLQSHLQELNRELGKKEDVEMHQVIPVPKEEFEQMLKTGKVKKSGDGFIDPNTNARIHPIFIDKEGNERIVALNSKKVQQIYNPQMQKIFDKVAPDIVHVHNGYYKPHLKIAEHAKSKGVGVVHTWHGGQIKTKGDVSQRKRQTQERLHKTHNKTADIADLNVCVSEIGKDSFDKNRDAVLVEYGVDIKEFDPDKVKPGETAGIRQRLGLNDDDFVFLFPGRYHDQKNQHGLIEAFAEVAKKDPHAKLVLAGQKYGDRGAKAYIKKIEGIVRQHGIKDQVHMLDRIESKEEMRAFYAMADAVVYASRNEGRGRSLVEAMSMGKPVLASDDAGLKDSIQHEEGDAGLLFNPDSLDQIVTQMNQIKDNKVLRKDLSKKGMAYANKELSMDAYAAKYHGIYKKVVAKNVKLRRR